MQEEIEAQPLPEDAPLPQLSLQTLDPTQREQVLRYLLDQLQAYQQQLRELQLQSQWRERQQMGGGSRDGLFPPLAPNSSAVAAGSEQPFGGGGMGMCGGLLGDYGGAPPHSGASASIGVQTASAQGAMFPGGIGSAGTADGDVGSVVAVNGPVRPWGKRAKDLPLTRHTPSTFQKARHGHAGGAVGVR